MHKACSWAYLQGLHCLNRLNSLPGCGSSSLFTVYCVLYVLYTVYKCPCTVSFSNACLSFSSGDLSESLHSLYCSVCHLLGVGQQVCLSIKLPVLSGVPGTRVYAPLELINIHLTYLSYAVCQVPGCMPRLSGSRSHATTGSRPPSGPWASCCMTWSAGTSPSRVTSRSVSPTSGRERRERERESETTKNERNS